MTPIEWAGAVGSGIAALGLGRAWAPLSRAWAAGREKRAEAVLVHAKTDGALADVTGKISLQRQAIEEDIYQRLVTHYDNRLADYERKVDRLTRERDEAEAGRDALQATAAELAERARTVGESLLLAQRRIDELTAGTTRAEQSLDEMKRLLANATTQIEELRAALHQKSLEVEDLEAQLQHARTRGAVDRKD